MVKRIISIILILSLALSNVVVAHGATTSAKVTELSGVVKVKRSGSAKEFDAFANMTISVGDKIRTGTGGTVTLVVDGENVITAGKNTSFTITDLSKVASEPSSAYTVHYGSVTNDVNKKGFAKDSYKVNTTNTVMGVRGTVFEVAKRISEEGNEAVSLVTLDGTVVVSDRAQGEDGTNSLNEIGAVTAGQQIVFSNVEENSGEVVVLDITKLNAETLGWLLQNVQYLSAEQKATATTTLVEAEKVEKEKAKNIEKVIENYTKDIEKEVIKLEKKDDDSSDEEDDIEVETPETGGDNTGTDGGDTGNGGDNTGTDGGDTGNGGDNTGTDGGDTGNGGDNTGTDGGDTGNGGFNFDFDGIDPDFGQDVATRYDYAIKNVDDFIKLNNAISTSGSAIVRTVSIENDLDFTGVSDWKPVDLKGVIINGNGKTIRNLEINETNSSSKIGLFASLTNSKVTNLKLDSIITNGSNAVYAGALAGTMQTCIVDNVNVANSTAVAEYAGGLAGTIITSGIKNVDGSNLTVVGQTTGGVAGEISLSGLANITVKSIVVDGIKTGGVVGAIYKGGITNATVSYSTISKYDNNNKNIVGGIAGYASGSIITKSKMSYNFMKTLGTVGGMIGVAEFTNLDSISVEAGTFKGMLATDSLFGEQAAGGIIGRGKNVNISIANVNIHTLDSYDGKSGGIFGIATGGNNVNHSIVNIQNISSYDIKSNGLVSENQEQVSFGNAIAIINDYDFTSNSTGQIIFNNSYSLDVEDNVEQNGLIGKTMDELKDSTLYLGWDTNIWNIVDGQIPTLK